MSNLKIQVGQPVQYVGLAEDPKAATITKVNADGTANLVVWLADELEPLRAHSVPQYVDTFDMRKTDQSHSFKVIRF